MSWLPPAITFEDGQRKLYGWLMAGAGLAYSIAVLCGVAFVVLGEWPPELDKTRLHILAAAIGGGTVGSIAVTIALAVGGPVGRFNVKAGKDGFGIDATGNQPVATTTTTVTATAQPPEQGR